MADQKITQLPEAVTIYDADLTTIVSDVKTSATSKKSLWSTIKTYILNGLEASQVSVAKGAGSPTVDTVQEYLDNIGSSGFYLGGELSDGGGGTLNVAAGAGFIRTSTDENSELQSFRWNALSTIAVTDNTTQYVYVNNSGTISLDTNEFLEAPNLIQIGVVTKEDGSVIHVFSLGVRLEESIGQAGRFIRRVHGITRDKRKGGIIFGQSGDANRDITITEGILWWGRTEYPISVFDTSGADTFQTYSAGGQEDATASQFPNEQYDNAGTLTNMTTNRWANLFFFIEPDDHIVMVYGRSQFTSQALAEGEGVPTTSLPSKVTETSILAARFTFQKSSNIAVISSAFDTLFANAGVTDHGNLAGLQGGVVGEYYHLTNAEYIIVGDTSGANTGDQTDLTNISDTKANFDTALSDGNFLFDGDVVVPVKASGAEIDTGTDDAKFATAKALTDSKYFKSDETIVLTNKAITKRVSTQASSATPTIDADAVDFHSITALATNITSMTTNLSGTPTEAQTLWIAITGTAARTITWGADFENGAVALPLTTITTQRLDIGLIWNTVTGKWRCMAVGPTE